MPRVTTEVADGTPEGGANGSSGLRIPRLWVSASTEGEAPAQSEETQPRDGTGVVSAEQPQAPIKLLVSTALLRWQVGCQACIPLLRMEASWLSMVSICDMTVR